MALCRVWCTMKSPLHSFSLHIYKALALMDCGDLLDLFLSLITCGDAAGDADIQATEVSVSNTEFRPV
ncbi:hypothetical protein AMECASPLE_022312 [Ameca splendens]|uniref:Uncharacterized protein n=1 Tax=Ameca splendens TaxID=208324 RepID=A0ABV0ZZC7_9TELE